MADPVPSAAPDSSSPTSNQPPACDEKPGDAPSVRFSSAVDVAPSPPAPGPLEVPGSQPQNQPAEDISPGQLSALNSSLSGGPLQTRRMNTFQFEPVSLPASRVPSRDEDSPATSQVQTANSSRIQSPQGSPRLGAMASPPLTPSGSGPGAAEKRLREADGRETGALEPQTLTPQPSSSQDRSGSAAEKRQSLPHRPHSDQSFPRPGSADDERSHRRGMFDVGPGSRSGSRDSSPSRSSASNFYSKPMTPGGDVNDPYAKGRRAPPQQHSRHTIDPRFVFSRKKKHGSPSSSRTSLAEKRGSGILGSRNNTDESLHSDEQHGHAHHHQNHAHGHSSSMVDLKRFFRKGGNSKKRDASPAPSVKSSPKASSSSKSVHQLPFGDDHGLTSKYGKLGRVLGSGAGGSVRLMKRREDGTVFAVKEFRARHTYETEKEYNKKVTAEFCVGSTLHHGNIIETLDIVQEKGRWYEVMELAPYDLFAIVMTGKMTRDEVTCCFLQILNGVTYLHSVGLAHRDLKLDNVVVSEKGIMKIIDFGSAHVYKYPFESEIVLAKGIVGSDPYLAPEVYDTKEYDAAAVDIWSLAIIYCCMTLRRFPWKLPRMTDNSYKLFAAAPTPGHDPRALVPPTQAPEGEPMGTEGVTDKPKQADDNVEPVVDGNGTEKAKEKEKEKEKEKQGEKGKDSEKDTAKAAATGDKKPTSTQGSSSDKKEVIRGPWRILRLLPKESRYIIWRMLDLSPKTRAGLDEILQEPWVADSMICQQLDDGEVLTADNHTHVLEPPASQQPDKTKE